MAGSNGICLNICRADAKIQDIAQEFSSAIIPIVVRGNQPFDLLLHRREGPQYPADDHSPSGWLLRVIVLREGLYLCVVSDHPMLAGFDHNAVLRKSTGSLVGVNRSFKSVDRGRLATSFLDEILA
jgi:hypothetical protein